ncbi:MAG: TonB-dependent receptor, partial [Sphingomonas sp.]
MPFQAIAQSSGDIIVTAQRREQRLQDVSLSATAFTGDQVAALGVLDADDIADLTPNVTAVNVFGNNLPNFSIRGVGLNSFAPNNSSPVAVHVDEVYYGYGVMLNFALFDIERVEVLRGPQGTLYGRNTTGGAISYLSRRPTREFEAGLTVGFGNFDNLQTEAFISGPLGENISGRLSGTYRRQWSGPYFNRFLNERHGEVDQLAFRAQLQFEPSENVTINLNIHGGRDRSDLAQYNMLPSGTAPGASPFCPQLLNGTLRGGEANCIGFIGEQEPDTDPFTAAPGFRPFMRLDQLGGVLTVNADLGFATLTSVTGYETLDRFVAEDADGFPQIIVDDYYENNIDQFSQEFRLAGGNESRFSWLLGAYYLTDTIDSPRFEAKSFFARGIGVNVTSVQDTETFAVFGQGEWQFAPQWRLVAGLRYTWEARSFEATNNFTTGDPNIITTAPGMPTTLLASANDRATFDNISGRLALEFRPDGNTLLYASVSRGFKSGGFNGNFAFSNAQFNRFDPENLYAYELGARLTLVEGRLFWNSAIFYYDYQDIQAVGNFLTTVGGQPANLFVLANLADARTYGAETEIWWRPNRHWDVRLAAGFLDA